MNKPRRRTFSPLEAARAIRARREKMAKGKAKPRKRPVFVPTAGPSLRDLIRKRTREYGARGRTVAGFARSPWIGGAPRQEIDNTRR